MDLEDWEFLSDDDRLLAEDDHGKNSSDPENTFHMNYFICPSPAPPSSPPPLSSQKFIKSSENLQNPLDSHPFQPDPFLENEKDGDFPEKIKAFTPSSVRTLSGDQETTHPQVWLINSPASPISDLIQSDPYSAPPPITIAETLLGDQESILPQQTSFIKNTMKENEFVDMKMDSHSPVKSCSNGIMGKFQFIKDDDDDLEIAKKPMMDLDLDMDMDRSKKQDNDGVWKWSFNGIGALCSIGVAAAATICIIILGSTQRTTRQNQKLRFQIYHDDNNKQRIKEVVQLHARRLNQAIAPNVNRAHITFGGYYNHNNNDALL